MISKWMVWGILLAGLVGSYDCRRRHQDDSVGSNPSPTTKPTAPNPVGMPTVPQVQPGGGLQPVAPPGMQPIPDPVAAGDFIAQQMSARQHQFAEGMNPVMPLTRGTLATSGAQNYAVQIQPGHCYKIIGVGSPSVTDLDLRLYAPSGIKVDEDLRTDNFPVVGLDRPLCPTTAGTYRLEVLMYAGSGDYGVGVFSN